MTIKGIDVSSWQGDIDWQAVVDAGYQFVMIKCTGGSSYRNPYYAQQLNGARAHNLICGSYHYDDEPSVGGSDGAAEAAFFLAQLDLQPGELLALDAEERATRDPARYRVWLDAVRAATGTVPLFYSFPSFLRELGAAAWEPVAGYPLWLASYDDPPLATVAPWARATIVQTSGGSPVPGTTFPTDVDVFSLDVDGDGDSDPDDLRALGQPDDVRAESKPLAPSGPQPLPPADDPSGVAATILPDGSVEVRVNFGGVATGIQGVNYADLGVSVVGADGALYDRSIQGGAFLPWRKRGA